MGGGFDSGEKRVGGKRDKIPCDFFGDEGDWMYSRPHAVCADDLPPFTTAPDPSPAHSASPPLQHSPRLHNRMIDTIPN